VQVLKKDLKQISDFIWEIPKSFDARMQVPARFLVDKKNLELVFKDRSLIQLVNTAMLKGAVYPTWAMPDIHEGFGPPIGGVVATEIPDGVISPGAVGFDINCGVRLLVSELNSEEIKDKIPQIISRFQKEIPAGLGSKSDIKLEEKDLDEVLKTGASFCQKKGMTEKDDLLHIESEGKIEGAEGEALSPLAKKRGHNQLGSLGSGNHFIDILKTEEIFNEHLAQKWGIVQDQIVLLIHSGSRGLGHQICSDFSKLFLTKARDYNISLPDPGLAALPFSSQEGQNYFKAMVGAANFAFANRQVLTHFVRKIWQKFFGKSSSLKLVYDVAHNIAKIENYKGKKILIHRKGATRAFPPNHQDLAPEFQKTGQPVIIPGSMGSLSYLLVGTETAEKTFYSVSHGAGRAMSRTQARKIMSGRDLQDQMKKEGIVVLAQTFSGLAEENPQAYKEIDTVIKPIIKEGLAKKVVSFKPLGVLIG